ncbi:hypothetical protein DPMN_127820 [Dreissena polymorpha]|uniref:Uncharacterized protein n=1 Tax=Dreissena polymorpha TaxID=45954 RepID=A0A9D4JZJ1_DREPO|nr:hypothetical protein DPMN_127820 [Dreissena polymorpha]
MWNAEETNVLPKFHGIRAKNVTSRTNRQTNRQTGQKQYVPHYYSGGHKKFKITLHNELTYNGSHVFQPTGIIFELVQDIIGMNLLNKFHKDWTINVVSRVKNAPPLGSHTNLLTKFHEDWTINVASRELTRQMLTPHDERRTKGDHKSSP